MAWDRRKSGDNSVSGCKLANLQNLWHRLAKPATRQYSFGMTNLYKCTGLAGLNTTLFWMRTYYRLLAPQRLPSSPLFLSASSPRLYLSPLWMWSKRLRKHGDSFCDMSELLVLKKSSVFFSLFMSCIIATFHSFNSTPCIIFCSCTRFANVHSKNTCRSEGHPVFFF